MEEPSQFWPKHDHFNATAIVRKLLGDRQLRAGNQLRDGGRQNRHGHHYWTFDYDPTFDVSVIEPEIRQRLDEMEWHFVSISNKVLDDGNGQFKWFGIAPILPTTVDLAYHATRISTIDKIRRKGLLPSNKERRNTFFPDTDGVIHVSRELGNHPWKKCKGTAVWWAGTLTEANGLGSEEHVVIRIDMKGLSARVYQDMHSLSGLVVDRLQCIPAERIKVVDTVVMDAEQFT